jgi:hypothetical protein
MGVAIINVGRLLGVTLNSPAMGLPFLAVVDLPLRGSDGHLEVLGNVLKGRTGYIHIPNHFPPFRRPPTMGFAVLDYDVARHFLATTS